MTTSNFLIRRAAAICIAVAFASGVGGASHASAQTFNIYGSVYTGSNGAASLYSIDATTGAATLIGAIGFNQVGGIDFNPLTGTLYGIGKTGAGTSVLISIDPTTGVGTQIGATGIANNISDISFRSDGTLFALDAFNHLYTINTSSGTASLVGTTSGDATGNGLAFSASDTLYWANDTNIYTVDQTTAAASAGPAVSFASLSQTNPRINGMDFAPGSGTLWASVATGSQGAGPNYFATVDVLTGIGTVIGQTQTGLDAIAVEQVPEPTATVLVGTAVLVAGMLRRKILA